MVIPINYRHCHALKLARDINSAGGVLASLHIPTSGENNGDADNRDRTALKPTRKSVATCPGCIVQATNFVREGGQ